MRTERVYSQNFFNDQSTFLASSGPVLHQHVLIESDNHLVNHLHQTNVVTSYSGMALEHRHLIKGTNRKLWEQALANDLGRLAQGVGSRMPSGTNAMFLFILARCPKIKGHTCSSRFIYQTFENRKASRLCNYWW